MKRVVVALALAGAAIGTAVPLTAGLTGTNHD